MKLELMVVDGFGSRNVRLSILDNGSELQIF
jgi:hypothetical protein